MAPVSPEAEPEIDRPPAGQRVQRGGTVPLAVAGDDRVGAPPGAQAPVPHESVRAGLAQYRVVVRIEPARGIALADSRVRQVFDAGTDQGINDPLAVELRPEAGDRHRGR